MEKLLCTAFRLTRGKLAERISNRISEIRCERRWREMERAHKAAGGVVVTLSHAAGEERYLA
jgi:hypothetical protein